MYIYEDEHRIMAVQKFAEPGSVAVYIALLKIFVSTLEG